MKKIYIGVILIFIALMFATCQGKNDRDPSYDADDNPIGTDPTRPNDVRALRSDRPFENPEKTDTICKEHIKIIE